TLALGSGGMLLSPWVQPLHAAETTSAAAPKRFIFFLQNQAFHPEHAQPSDLKIDLKALDHPEDLPLASMELPEPIAPLEAIKYRVTILHGLNGRQVRPIHGAPYGALGGFAKGPLPAGETIDCALGRALPAPFPFLGLGWESLRNMQSDPVRCCSSAWGPKRPAPLYANPLFAYKDLFGAAAEGATREQ